ncbi:uroporphyrinogen decarboxylase family protein [Clostridium moutaii]
MDSMKAFGEVDGVNPSYSEFSSPKLWERFVVYDIHCDGNWERDLDYFKDFPKGKIVFETDSVTDIYKIKDKLGDRECIKGDVPAGKLVFGTPDEVYDYASRLVRNMEDGFILSSGCSISPNAKPENVKAMISAATGK